MSFEEATFAQWADYWWAGSHNAYPHGGVADIGAGRAVAVRAAPGSSGWWSNGGGGSLSAWDLGANEPLDALELSRPPDPQWVNYDAGSWVGVGSMGEGSVVVAWRGRHPGSTPNDRYFDLWMRVYVLQDGSLAADGDWFIAYRSEETVSDDRHQSYILGVEFLRHEGQTLCFVAERSTRYPNASGGTFNESIAGSRATVLFVSGSGVTRVSAEGRDPSGQVSNDVHFVDYQKPLVLEDGVLAMVTRARSTGSAVEGLAAYAVSGTSLAHLDSTVLLAYDDQPWGSGYPFGKIAPNTIMAMNWSNGAQYDFEMYVMRLEDGQWVRDPKMEYDPRDDLPELAGMQFNPVTRTSFFFEGVGYTITHTDEWDVEYGDTLYWVLSEIHYDEDGPSHQVGNARVFASYDPPGEGHRPWTHSRGTRFVWDESDLLALVGQRVSYQDDQGMDADVESATGAHVLRFVGATEPETPSFVPELRGRRRSIYASFNQL